MDSVTFGVALYLILAVGIRGAQRRIYLRVGRVDNKLDFSMGTPPVLKALRMDSSFSEMIIIQCGVDYPSRALRCPRFCFDGSLSRMFCRTICQKPFPAEECNGQKRIDVDSTTFKNLNEELEITFRGYRAFYGFRGSDGLKLQTFKYNKTLVPVVRKNGREKRTVLTLREEPLIVGFSTEIIKLIGGKGVLGLRPSPQSFVPRLKANGHIERAIISIQDDAFAGYAESYMRSLSSVMFGALDKSICEWRRVPAYNSDGWTFEISDVKFVDTVIRGPSVVRIDLSYSTVRIPANLSDHYIATGFLTIDYQKHKTHGNPKDHMTFSVDPKNQSALRLEFRIGDELVALTSEMLMQPFSDRETIMAPNEKRRYSSEADWVFGTYFLNYFCFGYDYDLGEVAWGRRRRLDVVDLL